MMVLFSKPAEKGTKSWARSELHTYLFSLLKMNWPSSKTEAKRPTPDMFINVYSTTWTKQAAPVRLPATENNTKLQIQE